jgi:outer membrane protein assembly factor BamD (BamD/ComL family)
LFGTPVEAGDQNRKREKIQEVAQLFPKAYYYFSLVVMEYPDSPWADDSQNKLRIIDDRSKRYKRILDSLRPPT